MRKLLIYADLQIKVSQSLGLLNHQENHHW